MDQASICPCISRYGRNRSLFTHVRGKDIDQMIRSIEHLPVCDVAGARDAVPIVLGHGAASTRKWLVPQVEALSEEFGVIAVDRPAHGTLRKQRFRLGAAVQRARE